MNDIIGALGVPTIIGSYEDRLVRNTKSDEHGFELDTVSVYDRPWNYETAVRHDDFEFNSWIVLDGCDTKEAAMEPCILFAKSGRLGASYRQVTGKLNSIKLRWRNR